METFSFRLMLLGAILMIGAACYWMYEYRSPSSLAMENHSIRFMNKLSDLGAGAREYRTAGQIMQAKQRRAYWPGGIGLSLFLIGWAATPKRPEEGQSKVEGP